MRTLCILLLGFTGCVAQPELQKQIHGPTSADKTAAAAVTAREQYMPVTLASLSSFELDQTRGALLDVPESLRKLDGRRVMIRGLFHLDGGQDGIPLIVALVRDYRGYPAIQKFVFFNHPETWAPRFAPGDLVVARGILHVEIKRRDGVEISSLYNLDVDRVEIDRTEGN